METYTYKDLQRIFGKDFIMPPEELVGKPEIEYRCPYYSKCPAKKRCFVAAVPVPLKENELLNVRCILCGGTKIPIYAVAKRVT